MGFQSGSSVDVDDSTIAFNVSTQLEVKDGGVGATQLATDAVETAKIKDAAVTAAKLAAGVGGALQLVETKTLGAGATTISFTGLDIGTDGRYFFMADIKDTSASWLKINFNTDTTDTNYYAQANAFTNTTISGSRNNNPKIFGGMGSGENAFIVGWIQQDTAGYIVAITKGMSSRASAIRQDDSMICTSASVSNMTSLQFVAQNNMQTDTTISLYKIATS